MRPGPFLLATTAIAGSASADDLLDRLGTLTGSCETFVTVQFADCRVETYARCTDGSVLLSVHSQEIPEQMSHLTSDGDMMFSVSLPGMEGILAVIENRDPSSIGALLAKGEDSSDQTFSYRLPYMEPQDAVVRSLAALDGSEVIVDGRRLLSGSFALSFGLEGDAPSMRTTGEMLVDREWGVMLLGRSETMVGGMSITFGGEPTEFIVPGEPGFGSKVATQQCGTLSKDMG